MNSKLKSLLAVSILVLAGFVMLWNFGTKDVNVQGATLYVGSDSAYKTIQEAVDNATSGDTIYVKNETYYESVLVNKSNIELIGNSTTDCKIIHSYTGTSTFDYAAGINITADDVNITGFNISVSGSYTYGIFLKFYIDNINIISNHITTTGNYGHGIYLYFYSDYNNINDNIINTAGGDGYGIYLYSSSNNNNLTGNTINTTGQNGHGIYLYSSSNNNNLTGNTINTTGGSGYGINLHTSSNNNNLTGNTINTSGDNGRGIYLNHNSNNNNLTDNTINISGTSGLGIWLRDNSNNNNLTGNTINTTGQSGLGITLYLSSNNNITGNTINTTGISGHGIYLRESSNNDLIGNIINTSGSGDGIYLRTYSDNNNLTNNIINASGFGGKGINLDLSLNNNLTNNVINTSGDSAPGIIFDESSNNNLTGNIINTFGKTGAGIYLWGSSNNNNITGNIINTTGQLYSNGINLGQYSNYNNCTNNIINTTGDYAYGISLYRSSNNDLIGNTINTSGQDGYGIYLRDNSNNNNLTGNTINTSGQDGYGIYLYQNSNNNNLTGNTINTSGQDGYGIYLSKFLTECSKYNNLSGNIINTFGQKGNGIYLDQSSNNNNLTGNTINIFGSDGHGIYLIQSSNNNITGNTINTIDQWVVGIFLSQFSSNNNLTGNTINTSGQSGYGILLRQSSNYNNLTGNTINTSGLIGRGIQLQQSSNYNNLTGNTINTSGDSGSGIFIWQNSNSNNLTDNEIITFGSNAYGIYIVTNSNYNNITNNTVVTTQSGANGISIESSNHTSLMDCNISTSGLNAHAIYLDELVAIARDSTLVSTNGNDFNIRNDGNITVINCSFNTVEVTNDGGGVIQVKNYLTIQAYYEGGVTPIQNADVLIEDDGASVYNTSGYGGTDTQTDASGKIDTLIITDRWYIYSNTATENVTTVKVKKTVDVSWEETRDVDMNASHTETFTASDIFAPTIPTGLKITRIPSTNNLNISWDLNSDDTVNYTIYTNISGQWEVLINLTHPTNWTIDSDLPDKTWHYYKIQAWDEAEVPSALSAPKSFYLTDITPPGIPTGLKVTRAASTNTLNISWDLNPDTVNYTVYTNKSGSWSFLINVTHPTSWTLDEDLPDETWYYYKIKAWDKVGWSSDFTTSVGYYLSDITPPGIPSGLMIVRIANTNSLNISWDLNIDDTVNYSVYTNRSGQWNLLCNVTHPINWTLDEDLPDETWYYYKIQAWDNVNLVSGNLTPVGYYLSDITPPAMPTGLSVIPVPNGDALNISWVLNTDDTVKYELWWNDIINGKWVKLGDISHPKSWFVWANESLINGSTYEFKLRAWDKVELPSEFTAPESVVHRDYLAPGAPTNLIAETLSETSINLNWNASSDLDVERYRVYLNESGEGTGGHYMLQDEVDSATLSYQFTELLENTAYYFVVLAIDEANNTSPFSEEAWNTTKALPPLVRPEVTDTTPAKDATGVAVNSSVTITFSIPMDTTSVENVLTITPLVDYTPSWNPPNTILTIQFTVNLSYNTTYTITIGDAKATTGGILEDAPFILSFTTEKEIIIPTPTITISPSSVNIEVAPGETITISGSSTDLDEGTEVTVTLEGETETGTIAADGSWSVTIKAPTTPGDYKLTVTAGDQSKEGTITIKEPKSITITTPLANIEVEPGETITVSGTSVGLEVGIEVTVTLGDETETGTIGANGGWSVTIKAPETLNTYMITVEAGGQSDTRSITVKEPVVTLEEEEEEEETPFDLGTGISYLLFIIIIIVIIIILIIGMALRKPKPEEEELIEEEESEEFEE